MDKITEAGPLTSMESHQMRITDHGKINLFVAFALEFLQKNPHRPLIFHTFPSAKAKGTIQTPENQPPPVNTDEQSPVGVAEPPRKKRKLATTTATIPRLITVVEIVKREYGKWAATRKTAEGGLVEDSLRMGLHQYNELACLEDLGLIEPHDQGLDDAEQLKMALEGKNYLKQKFTPHLKVTLSVRALPELEAKGQTHQPPAPPKTSRAAKARQRKRQKKNEKRMS